jgi:hypothetical protein
MAAHIAGTPSQHKESQMLELAARSQVKRRTSAVASAVLAGLALAATGPVTAFAAKSPKPSVPSGFTITKLADAPKGAGNCDDLAFLAGHLFMGCQNKTLSNGGGGNSTLVEFTPAGAVVNTWTIKDKIDGMAADPLKNYVIVSLNEDANSHLATITPSAPAGQQLVYYTYSPDPRAASTPVALRTGGGTDQVSVDGAGHVLITGSHAGTKTGTAVFKVELTTPSSSTGTGTAALSPTFLDNASATNSTGSGTSTLALGDVDSGAIVPQDSPRFGGSYVITDQTALELVFASNIFSGTGLTVLKTAFGLDDILWTTSTSGTLYVVDKGPTVNLPAVSPSALYKVTGPFTKNTVLAANDGVGDQVVSVNLTNGKLTPFVRHLQTTKGLVYLNPDGSQTQLALAGAAAATTSTTPTTGAPTTTTAAKKSSSSNTGLIIGIIVAVLLIAGGGGFWFMRRGGGG